MSVQYKDENGILQKGAGLYKSEVPIGIADIYTEGERQVGVWTDGKPLYQKTINCGTGGNAQTVQIAHNVVNIDKYVACWGIFTNNGQPIPVPNGGNDFVRVQFDNTYIIIKYGTSWESYSGLYVTIQYTKTTDTATGVLPKSASALYLLGDVEISNLQDGDVLKYDDDDNKWKNGVGGGGGNANIWTGTQAELEEVFDELEEGTQINITDDEQEVVDGGTIYSEDEQVIGLWTDNKPLYQKTINIGHNASIDYDISDLNIDNCINCYGVIDGYGNVPNITPYMQYSITMVVTGNNTLAVRIGSSLTVTNDIIATIQYTKTTDAPLDAVVGKKTMYIASSDCYSTEEKEIGCWTDGKPLYQKTFIITPTSASFTVDVSSLNLEKLIDRQATLSRTVSNPSGTQQKDVQYRTETSGYNGYGVVCELINNTIQVGIEGYTVSEITEIRVTLKYTKTTDTAGSGSYTPASGKAVHYSTDEQVIGTFLGETLYRKTFDIGNLLNNGTKTVAHGISNLKYVVNWSGTCYSTIDTGYCRPIPLSDPTVTNTIRLDVGGGNISIKTASDWSAYKAFVTLEYTKTV